LQNIEYLAENRQKSGLMPDFLLLFAEFAATDEKKRKRL